MLITLRQSTISRRQFRHSLSPRQSELLALVERGVSRKEAADVMGLSENTVKKHTKALLRKAQCGSTRDMIFRRLCLPVATPAPLRKAA